MSPSCFSALLFLALHYFVNCSSNQQTLISEKVIPKLTNDDSVKPNLDNEKLKRMKNETESAKYLGKVLFVAARETKSHQIFLNGVIDALATGGYEVVLISPYKFGKKLPNVREVTLEFNKLEIVSDLFKDGKWKFFWKMFKNGTQQCFSGMDREDVRSAMKEDYDLIFLHIFCSCYLPEIHEKKVPFVIMTPNQCPLGQCASKIGNPIVSSIDYDPMMIGIKNPKNFLKRMISSYITVLIQVFLSIEYYRTEWYGRNLGYFSDEHSIRDINSKASLIISNSYRLAEPPRPYMPNILPLGCIQCRDPRPLPQDIEDWVGKSPDVGFIYFSLGSIVKPSQIPTETLQAIMSVLGSLPQRVIMKFDLESVASLPENIKILKWAPQQDILGHPNIRLFITHGGLLSTTESIHHGVPVLGIPGFLDQEANMEDIVNAGVGLTQFWQNLTHESFSSKILTLLSDPKYRENTRNLAELRRDRPLTPAQEIVWWTGYLIRTKGARHLQSPAVHMAWYELYDVDVWLFTFTVIALGNWAVFKVARTVWRRCRGGTTKKKTD